jgi:putative nucleotidyltransferase with HDIG domain
VEVGHEQPRWLLLKLTALLHDIGKPATRSVGADGRIHFYRHDEVGARQVEPMLRRLKFPSKSVARVARIIAAHLRPLQLSQHLPPSRKALYRFFQAAGDASPEVALLSIADQRGKAFAEDREAVVAVVRQMISSYFEEHEALVAVTPLLNGQEIMAVTGLKPGPRVGQVVAKLREAQAVGRVSNREEALEYLQRLVPPKPAGGE